MPVRRGRALIRFGIAAGAVAAVATAVTVRNSSQPGPAPSAADAQPPTSLNEPVSPPWAAAAPVPLTPQEPAKHPRTSSPPRPAAPPQARPVPAAQASQVLRVGSRGDRVVDAQRRLGRLQLYVGPVDGYYSADVAAAVARIQQARAVAEPLGVYGPRTRAAVEAETATVPAQG